MKRKNKEGEEKMAELKRRLGEAEKGRREAEERLAQAGHNPGAHNYLKVIKLTIPVTFKYIFLL